MKWLLLLAGCAVFLSGCQDSAEVNSSKSAVEVIIEGDGEFPEFLVGTWKSGKKTGWEFVFEPDGTISLAIISYGRFPVRPGQITTIPMKFKGKTILEPGQWMVNYSPDTRELTVRISMKRIRTELGDVVLERKSDDVFIGTVSADGNSWPVDWTSFANYTGHTPEIPDFNMSTDPIYGESQTVIFEKVEE